MKQKSSIPAISIVRPRRFICYLITHVYQELSSFHFSEM
jgi:hypothetical protein